MINLNDYYKCLRNFREMSKKISKLDMLKSEKDFLHKSLENTCSFEKGSAGKYYYNLGDGKKYDDELLSLSGNYLFFVRVLDNVIDGHINGKVLDKCEAESVVKGIAKYVSGRADKDSVKKEFSDICGFEGTTELAQVFKDEIDVYMKDKKHFIKDFYGLTKIWGKDISYDNIRDYEKGLRKVGSYMQCTLLDLAECFPDFSKNKSENIRKIVSLMGIVAQLRDDIVDNDKGVSSDDLNRLLEKYKHKLYFKADDIGVGRNVKLIHEAYPLAMKITDSKNYKKIRNHLAMVS